MKGKQCVFRFIRVLLIWNGFGVIMERVQRKRTKGWRTPPNTKYVGRGTKFGNPYRVTKDGSSWVVTDGETSIMFTNRNDAHLESVNYRLD